MSTETVARPDVVLQPGGGVTKRRHYFRPPNDWPGTGREWGVFAILNGIEVIGLCGRKYVPDTEAKGLPVCEECATIAADILLGGD